MAKAATLNIDIVATAEKAVEAFDKVKEKAASSFSSPQGGGHSSPPPPFWPGWATATKAAADHEVSVSKLSSRLQGRRRPAMGDMNSSL